VTTQTIFVELQRTIKIENLPHWVNEFHLKEVFSCFNIEEIHNPVDITNSGFAVAFLTLHSMAGCNEAIGDANSTNKFVCLS
jgi:hypothetical protein